MSADVLERPVEEVKPKVTGILYQGNVRSVPWDKDDPTSVAVAQEAFYTGLRMGMAAFETVDMPSYYGGTRKEEVQTRAFNPETEQIRMTAQYAGG
jgi:hypothetical protein